ncbi:MAG TPA: fibronectin type III domain-containing protein, partial [Jatrophihabitans sp.]|nr:fibronectin type III domain-containing protein [Jatrophihabitans sp.]
MILPRFRFSGRRGAATLAELATVAGVGTALAPAAGATAAVTATPTATASAAPNATTALAGLSVTGSGTLQVTLSTDVGTLSLPSNTAAVLAYNNHWTGDQAVTFSGAQSDVDAVLGAAKLVEGAAAGQTAHVTLSAMIQAPNLVYSAPNQHFYQFVSAPGISWTDAEADAALMSFQGQAGYLATMPTAAVNAFVTNKIPGALNVWFGATSIDTPAAPIQRTWQWTDGPLHDQPFSYCSNFLSVCDFVSNTGLYSNWSSGEPNNYQGIAGEAYSGEWDAVTNWGSANGLWNDLPPDWTGADGYVVEYGDQAIGSSDSFGGAVQTVASNVVIAGKPSAPTGVAGLRGNTTAKVSWTAPASNGSLITGYTVRDSQGGTHACAASPCTVTGLTNGTAYTFTVTATNAYGEGPASAASAAVTPATVPGAPTGVTATRGAGSASVAFAAPADNGGAAVLDYTVTAAPGGASATCASSPCVVSGLANGTSYTFTVHATNNVGNGAESDGSAPVTPATVPGAPAAPTVTRGDRSVDVTFGAPASDGGSPITGYVVHIWDGETEVATQACETSPCTVPGLTNGTSYVATVSAVNDVDAGPQSSPSTAFVPATVPSAPADLTVERTDGALLLTFDPAADNGAEVTGYEYSVDGGQSWHELDATPAGDVLHATASELQNGTLYSVGVRAVNAVGAGAAATEDGTPATVPDAPTGVTAVRGGSGELVVSWSDGASDGGDAVTGYRVHVHRGETSLEYDCAQSPCTV